MRVSLLVFLAIISFNASAQFLSLKKHDRLPEIEKAVINTKDFVAKTTAAKPAKLVKVQLPVTDYTLELIENSVMKTAQHNMRFRVYDVASYNFSDLAGLYVQQNRYSEAKWFYLQSSIISRQQNNDKLTISNLINLAGIKSQIGDFILAQQDLFEARDMASSHGWLSDLINVEKKLKDIQCKRIISRPTELRYASNVMAAAAVVE